MYKSFKNFKEDRDIIDFGKKYDNLCLSIIESGITFDQFWQQHGLPFFINGSACNEQELIEGWGFGNFFGGKSNTPQQQPQVQSTPQAKPKPQQPPLSADLEMKTSAAMNDIKQAFNRSMTGVVEKYRQNRDSVGYQLAKGFLDKVNAYAEKLKIKRGEGKFDRNSEFGQSANVGKNVNVGDRWKQMASTPQGKETMANQYSTKLGVSPDIIKKLIDSGFTNPSLWPGMIAQQKQNQQSRVQPTVGGNFPSMQNRMQPVS